MCYSSDSNVLLNVLNLWSDFKEQEHLHLFLHVAIWQQLL